MAVDPRGVQRSCRIGADLLPKGIVGTSPGLSSRIHDLHQYKSERRHVRERFQGSYMCASATAVSGVREGHEGGRQGKEIDLIAKGAHPYPG